MFWIGLLFFSLSVYMSYRNANQGTGTEFQKPQAPNVEEGKPIGVVFGRVKITEGTVYWWGDLSYAEIKK